MEHVLIMHHVEGCWESGLRKYGTSIDEMINKLDAHLEQADYDRVILTRFEDDALNEEHLPIAHHISAVHEYGYGWVAEMFKASDFVYNEDYCEGGTHSEVVLIEKWMKQLKGSRVSLCGAFDGECINDMETALEHLGIHFERLEDLIVG